VKVKNKRKKIYVGLSADILHEGHINILKKAKSLGHVTVGLLTDEAITTYKKLPHLTFHQREIVLKNIKMVDKVVPQTTLDYRPNLIKYKPDLVVHGDDWKSGIQKETRKQVITTLKKWSGKLIEVPYTKNISSSLIKKKIMKTGTTPEVRQIKFKRLINVKKIVRILEAHSPLSAMIVENTNVVKKNKFYEFDGMWSSSLTDSALRGKPDNESVDLSVRMNTLNEILSVTTKPIIFDADTGGRNEHLPYTVKALESAGISAIIIEDKIGLKKNSLFQNQSNAKQDNIKNFCKKIKVAVNAKISDDFMIIARIESFILGKNLNDALKRAEAYSKSGADAILIHSKEKKPDQIIQFSKKFIKSKYRKPIVAVPSTYSSTYEKTLQESGVNVIIYANHLLRASYPSMMKVAESILKFERSKEAEKNIIPIKEIISLIK
tara:strand:+ start:926 stop:2233 length:1308 start_codon:yes stop_codon:yes gene_type:complete